MEANDENRLIRKNWLGCSDVASWLQVSRSTVKNLWTSGRLAYKVAPNLQGTRKTSISMLRDFQRRETASML